MRFDRDPDWNDDGHTWLVGWMLGVIGAGLLGLALALTSCWRGERPTYPAAVDPPSPRRIVTTLDCSKLTELVGKVPKEPELLGCVDVDVSDYWFCRAERVQRYADDLRSWVTLAIAECTP